MTRAKWRRAVFVVLAVAGGTALAWQWRTGLKLQSEADRQQTQNLRIDRLRAENKRLRALQVSAAELEVLRADHAALPRLRAEIEALRKHLTATRPSSARALPM